MAAPAENILGQPPLVRDKPSHSEGSNGDRIRSHPSQGLYYDSLGGHSAIPSAHYGLPPPVASAKDSAKMYFEIARSVMSSLYETVYHTPPSEALADTKKAQNTGSSVIPGYTMGSELGAHGLSISGDFPTRIS